MQRLIEYISRCPFSLARVVKITDDRKVMYHASHPTCTRFPMLGQEMDLRPGIRRNYQVFDPLDFLACVTQHIPNKGDHLLRYYGWYSNKKRGMRKSKAEGEQAADKHEELSEYQIKGRITWAALIKCVYEVNPLECPKCGAEMKIVGFIEREETGLIRMLLSAAGLWREPVPRAPPPQPVPVPQAEEHSVDYEFFAINCA
jgi:hypothetical protein